MNKHAHMEYFMGAFNMHRTLWKTITSSVMNFLPADIRDRNAFIGIAIKAIPR